MEETDDGSPSLESGSGAAVARIDEVAAAHVAHHSSEDSHDVLRDPCDEVVLAPTLRPAPM